MAQALSGRGSRAPINGINVTPLVDVVLVLLVIMMVSATYIVSQSLKVELPKTASADETVASPLIVTITPRGQYLLGGREVDSATLASTFASAHAASSTASVVISADRGARHGSVVEVIDLAKSAGIVKFAINVERSK